MTEFALHFRAWGDPDLPPVIFLHGFMGRHSDWETVIADLEDSFYCIALDLPGHGGSPLVDRQGAPENFEQCGGKILALADYLNLSRFALVGYSMGGRLALYLARCAPGRCFALAAESASPGLRNSVDCAARLRHDELLAEQLRGFQKDTEALRTFLEEWYAQPLFGSLTKRPEALAKAIASRLGQNPVESAAALTLLGVARQPSQWKALSEWTVPTVCLVGAEDRKYALIAEQMSEISPRIAVEVFADCSHNVHLENPTGYTTVLKRFLHATWNQG